MPGPTIFSPADLQLQHLAAILNRMQEERFRRQEREHFQGIEDEAKQKQTTGLIAGAAVGGVAGLAFAPAAASATTLAGAGIKGAQIGAGIGGSFGSGDVAGGVQQSLSAVSGLVQAQSDLNTFGFVPSDKERAGINSKILEFNLDRSVVMSTAASGGMSVFDQLQAASLERMNDKSLREFMDKNGQGGVRLESFKAAALEHEGGRFGLSQEIGAIQRENRAKQQGMNTFARVTAESNAEVENAARRSTMEAVFDPLEVAKRSADNNEIDEMVRLEEIPVEVGSAMKRAQPPLRTHQRPRKTPLTIQEVGQKQVAAIPVRDSQGNIVDHLISSLDRDGRVRSHGRVSEGERPAPTDFSSAMRQLSPQQQLKVVNDAGSAALLAGGKAIEDKVITPEEAVAHAKASFDALQNAIGARPPQPGQPAQPGAAQALPLSPQGQQTYQTLIKAVATLPIEQWSQNELEQGAAAISSVADEIFSSGIVNEEMAALADQLAAIEEAINAKRARNP